MSEKTKAHLQFFGLMVVAGFMINLMMDIIRAITSGN